MIPTEPRRSCRDRARGRARVLRILAAAACLSLAPLARDVAAQQSGFDDISVDFLKVRRAPASIDSPDSLRGTVFHRAGAFTFIHALAPIDQWVWIAQGFITVYYPSERRALRIRSDNPIDFSFFQAFLNISGAELGLPRMGFTVALIEAPPDSIITTWTPSEALAKSLGQARTVHTNDLLRSLEYHDAKGDLIARIEFDEYLKTEGLDLPLHIALATCGASPKWEDVYFSNPTFEKSLIDSIESLRIPPEISIESLGRE